MSNLEKIQNRPTNLKINLDPKNQNKRDLEVKNQSQKIEKQALNYIRLKNSLIYQKNMMLI